MSAPARRSTGGSVAVIVAITLTVLIGFSALGSEVVFALFKQRQMQATASAAAFAGAVALTTGYPAAPATEARAVAASAGFVSGTAGTTVTVNIPPLSGAFVGQATAVEVIVTQPQTLPLSSMFRAGPWNITVRAVATQGSGGDCVLDLDGTSAGALTINNGASLTLNQCGLAVNATGSEALDVAYGSIITTSSVTVGGGVYDPGSGIHATNGVATDQPAVLDPYAGTVLPTVSACNHTAYYANGGTNPTLTAGVYCNGLSMGGGGTVTMGAGVYIIDGGSFAPAGGVTVIGTGVTIFLTGTGSNYATVNISNGVTVTLSAPTAGATKGLVFFGDPAAPSTNTNSFEGGSTMNLTGALYFPSQTVVYGNGSSTAAQCTQLVAWQVSFAGGSTFSSNCGSAGTSRIGGNASALVE